MTIFTAIVIAILIVAFTPSQAQMALLSAPVRITLQIVRTLSMVLLIGAAAIVVIGLLLFGLCLAAAGTGSFR